MASILNLFGFHISQMSPMGMVRVRHFDFLCRSQGLEPSVEKFRAFYQLIRNMGFYSFGLRAAKKILINPPKSFHDWKMKIRSRRKNFQFQRRLTITCTYSRHQTGFLVNQVLVAAGMSDKWPEHSEEVPVLMFNGEVAQLYQAAFPTFGGAMGMRPLESGEVCWYEQIKANFLYPPARAFANPTTTIEGAQLPKPKPLRGVTSAGKEILYLSSEESVGSSHEELSSWSNIFAGVLRDLGIDPEEKPKKAPTKKKTTSKKKVIVDTGATSKKAGGSRAILEKGTLRFRQSNLEDYVVASDSLEGLSRIGEQKKSSAAASKSSGSAGSRAPESDATPSSLYEEEEEDVEEEGDRLVTRKRSREETTAGDTPPTRKVVVTQPIGKQGSLRNLYKFTRGTKESCGEG
ncbi:hypothetical protein HanRHA438_Chr09g0409561 [Helianthus annuus]|uniref:Transposase (Putative), gypsy type n=1 Tax=Helianthus annuus TaxID=4232 RepID=A0A9K3I761_HELAN|nr:hypothetical protein HanXRQr2_Chr09g0397861 [Helianthus annuus]KAJ0526733.1 hypothetical protein HanHA300_Chr09g0326431 [Helianthus annuus]KAJ0535256.1 hypothetical protein HanIR_Chr09g0428711 [Helianthus annuus]KAJ0543127.1 hypothetical protein HanHA89_Chr09g0347351 [Helianthus annuus]KAJ0708179.1 hypothetical protein HanLR1_Chr09g0326661 [Helianthus annuus]